MKSIIERKARSKGALLCGKTAPKGPLSLTDFEIIAPLSAPLTPISHDYTHYIIETGGFGFTQIVKHLRSRRHFALKTFVRTQIFKNHQVRTVVNITGTLALMVADQAHYE